MRKVTEFTDCWGCIKVGNCPTIDGVFEACTIHRMTFIAFRCTEKVTETECIITPEDVRRELELSAEWHLEQARKTKEAIDIFDAKNK
jgi:hypothetical protein